MKALPEGYGCGSGMSFVYALASNIDMFNFGHPEGWGWGDGFTSFDTRQSKGFASGKGYNLGENLAYPYQAIFF